MYWQIYLLTYMQCMFSGTPDDGTEVLWKGSFESHYTEITELGR